jgi:hypothetical protein
MIIYVPVVESVQVVIVQYGLQWRLQAIASLSFRFSVRLSAVGRPGICLVRKTTITDCMHPSPPSRQSEIVRNITILSDIGVRAIAWPSQRRCNLSSRKARNLITTATEFLSDLRTNPVSPLLRTAIWTPLVALQHLISVSHNAPRAASHLSDGLVIL